MILVHWIFPPGREYEIGPNEEVALTLQWVEPSGIVMRGAFVAPIPEGSRISDVTFENSL